MISASHQPRVTYLFGAGASHACVTRFTDQHPILMSHLNSSLHEKLSALVNNYDNPADDDLKYLVNSVIDESTDFEQVVTFLEDTPSLRHRQFADDMRRTFEEVLHNKLTEIRADLQDDPTELYEVLLDIHNIAGFDESLHGIMTTNYDEYIEKAAESIYGCPVDFGIEVLRSPSHNQNSAEDMSVRLLKLHGSFGWIDTWPISAGTAVGASVWIPPGLQKPKNAYPFNVLWGLAREMLSCDVLRIVGFKIGPNDWDLMSLLFAMRHVNVTRTTRIEIIDDP
ncbi:hypothetical protein F4Y93_05625, partial [Candidatus Poribacteria bacterium]|nr:hypothetical protein [Candidatus Poribacteria bacterium]